MTRTAIVTLLALVVSAQALAQPSYDFDDWLEDRIQERLGSDVEGATANAVDATRVAAGTRSLSNQTEVPSMASNGTTLVDTTDASDLIGLALNLADLSGASEDDSGSDTTDASATVSGYALYSALTGRDPLAPTNYCRENAQLFRWISGTIGFENGDGSDNQIIAGGKLLIPFFSRRNPCDPEDFKDVQQAVEGAAMDYAEIHGGLQEAFYSAAVAKGLTTLSFTDFVNTILSVPAEFELFLQKLGKQEVDGILQQTVTTDPFAKLDEAAAKAVREFEQQPRVAVEFVTKQQEGGDNDDYSVLALFDLGELTLGEAKIFKLPTGLRMILNGGWEKNEESDSTGGTLAFGLEYALSKSSLRGARPMRFGVSTDAKWMSSAEDQYRGQLKLTVPILDGFELPISMTIANRTELVDETEVRGLVGFTVDTARLAPLLGNLHSLRDLLG
jgi:hypothetical protein